MPPATASTPARMQWTSRHQLRPGDPPMLPLDPRSSRQVGGDAKLDASPTAGGSPPRGGNGCRVELATSPRSTPMSTRIQARSQPHHRPQCSDHDCGDHATKRPHPDDGNRHGAAFAVVRAWFKWRHRAYFHALTARKPHSAPSFRARHIAHLMPLADDLTAGNDDAIHWFKRASVCLSIERERASARHIYPASWSSRGCGIVSPGALPARSESPPSAYSRAESTMPLPGKGVGRRWGRAARSPGRSPRRALRSGRRVR